MAKKEFKTVSSEVEACRRLVQLGIFSLHDVRRLGISQSNVSRLVARGKIMRAGRGYYFHPESRKIRPEELDYIVGCARFGPKSVIGGLSALAYYGLLEQIPQQIWVLVPANRQSRDRRYRLLRVQRPIRRGVEDHGTWRITSLDRTVVEALKYSAKIGQRVAIRAIRVAIAQRKTSLERIARTASDLGFRQVIQKHWEVLVASLERAT